MTTRPEWKDISSYSQGDKERIPKTWELRLDASVRIVIVRSHIYNPESWVMHCDPWFRGRDLHLASTVENRDEAAALAVALVRQKIVNLYAVMREV